MIFTVDIGNTNVCFGVFEEDKLVQSWKVEARSTKTVDEYASWFKNALADLQPIQVEASIVVSVVPSLDKVFYQVLKRLVEAPIYFVDYTNVPFEILIDNKSELGADRIINTYSGFQKFKKPLIIVDFGTATTFDIVGKKGEYLGGVIAPNIAISMEVLSYKTAKLPRVDIEVPEKVIGKNTVEHMKSGIFFGYIGMLDYIVKKIKNELEFYVTVVATGGYAEMLAPHSQQIDLVVDDLTIWGLSKLYYSNFKTQII